MAAMLAPLYTYKGVKLKRLAQIWCIFPRVIQINTKFANFVGLYFPHFTTFRGQTLQFY